MKILNQAEVGKTVFEVCREQKTQKKTLIEDFKSIIKYKRVLTLNQLKLIQKYD